MAWSVVVGYTSASAAWNLVQHALVYYDVDQKLMDMEAVPVLDTQLAWALEEDAIAVHTVMRVDTEIMYTH